MHKRAETLMPLLWNRSTLTEVNMSDYFMTNGFKQDFTNLLKSILLISKRLEELTAEVKLLRGAELVDPHKEKETTEQ